MEGFFLIFAKNKTVFKNHITFSVFPLDTPSKKAHDQKL